MALDLLRADVEQADGRLGDAQYRAREDLAHDRELHQVLRVTLGVGAEVEEDRLAAPARHERGDRRALDARERAQHELGERHEGAGVAGGDGGRSLPLLHRVDRKPHAGRAALAQDLGWPGVALDPLWRMLQRADAREPRPRLEHRLDLRLVPEEQKRELGMALARHVGAGDHNLRRMVAAHGIERDG
jgi:hypothetical protein